MKTSPNYNREVSQFGIDFIKRWEGFSATTYLDVKGVPTIGYGTTDPEYAYAGNTITRELAEELLQDHVEEDEVYCRRIIRVPLSQEQWDAVISLCYNIGKGNFNTSILLRKLNRGDYLGAAGQFQWWRKSGGKVIPGLVNRRKEEAELFLRGTQVNTSEPRIEDAEEPKPNVSPPAETNVVPDAPPNPHNRAKVAGGVAATAGALSQISQVEQVRDAVAPLAGFNEYLGMLFVGVSLLAIWYMLKKGD